VNGFEKNKNCDKVKLKMRRILFLFLTIALVFARDFKPATDENFQ
jgi:hypothetical protein